eukprot:m.146068 g.146068  ORF g.146068 m.146068 type:complete len:241 (+) comp23088_c0_seq2:135-857(+)
MAVCSEPPAVATKLRPAAVTLVVTDLPSTSTTPTDWQHVATVGVRASSIANDPAACGAYHPEKLQQKADPLPASPTSGDATANTAAESANFGLKRTPSAVKVVPIIERTEYSGVVCVHMFMTGNSIVIVRVAPAYLETAGVWYVGGNVLSNSRPTLLTQDRIQDRTQDPPQTPSDLNSRLGLSFPLWIGRHENRVECIRSTPDAKPNVWVHNGVLREKVLVEFVDRKVTETVTSKPGDEG